jgi:uroporphyrinogen-III synthase
MRPLDGIGVLVTRPPHQAMPLCRALEAQGARVVRFPALEIVPLAEPRELEAQLAVAGRFDLIIFSSANAVRYGAALLNERRGLTLAAVGPATARALNQAGYRVAVLSSEGADSESLLRHPKLAAVAGNRILLVKGSGGRDLLRAELTRRGAAVTAIDVYRREPTRPSAADSAALAARLGAGEIQVITATSAEIGRSLLALADADAELGRAFARALWLVPGERVAAALREAGCPGTLLLARSAEDQELVAELLRWRASESGA